MTASELKRMYEENNPDSPFFSRKTMGFFGDTMKNFGVTKSIILSHTNSEGVYDHTTINKIVVLELFRKRPVKYGLNSSHFFLPNSMKEVYPVKEGVK